MDETNVKVMGEKRDEKDIRGMGDATRNKGRNEERALALYGRMQKGDKQKERMPRCWRQWVGGGGVEW